MKHGIEPGRSPKQTNGIRMEGLLEEGRSLRFLHLPSRIHNHDAARPLGHDAEIMRYQKKRHRQIPPQAVEQFKNLCLDRDVTFANLLEVKTPDPLTAIIVLAKPAPFLLEALDASESPIVARHIYEGTDPLTSKNASAPIGTGPFIFKEWVKGSHVILERNPSYWDKGKPYLDRIVIRFISDDAARAAAFETGEIDLGGGPPVSRSDIARITALPDLGSETRGYEYSGAFSQLFFNFENPILKDRRVRLAIAHSLDLDRLLDTVWLGYGQVSSTPISSELTKFHDTSIKPYGYDLAEANRLLDEAGYPRKADGTRFSLRLFNNPYNTRATGEFIKQALTKIGIAVNFQVFDFATYIAHTYTNRDFDVAADSLSNTFDPTLGVQRAYWSKNFKVGLPFSNASHYENADVDRHGAFGASR
jgi:peptide/nickel transport system substrate-binding protein